MSLDFGFQEMTPAPHRTDLQDHGAEQRGQNQPGASETRVLKRRVYHVGGYDPAPPSAVFERFAKELKRFERAWNVRTTISELTAEPDLATWQVSAAGPNWRTETEVRLVRWDDLIAESVAGPTWGRLIPGAAAFFDFLSAGAFVGYLRSSWRYAMFFIYPFVILMSIIALAIGSFYLVSKIVGSVFFGLAVLFLVVCLLLYVSDRLLYLGLLLDDWIFSRHYIRFGNEVLDVRLQRVAADIAASAQSEAVDEVLIVGHSLGAVLAVDLIDRATKLQLERRVSRKLAFFSVGASILKIGLHRAARGFREAVGRVSSNPDVVWADYRARSDVMNFYGADLLRDLRLPATGSPMVRNVSIRRMIAPERYPRIRRNWYKMHCQFVRANDRRAPYDYFMSICGPISAEQSARSERGVMDLFDADGQLIESVELSGDLDAAGVVKL
ncbi:hypothetical protein [Bosea sp. TAF32]|uniref:hypothetical protein n=1 Tax=Bosea sp. TAF32 TaxID=3237482 RepID=UPI003F93344D